MEDISPLAIRRMKNIKKAKDNWVEYYAIPIYRDNLWIGVGSNLADLCKLCGMVDQKPNPLADAAMYRDDEGSFAILFSRGTLTHGTIGHEVSHAALRIAIHHGWSHNKKTMEPYSYLSGWISDRVYESIVKHKEKISHGAR